MNIGSWTSFEGVKLRRLKLLALKPFWPNKKFRIRETTDQALISELSDFIDVVTNMNVTLQMAQGQHNPRFGEKFQKAFLYREFFSEMSTATERGEPLALGDESVIPVPPSTVMMRKACIDPLQTRACPHHLPRLQKPH